MEDNRTIRDITLGQIIEMDSKWQNGRSVYLIHDKMLWCWLMQIQMNAPNRIRSSPWTWDWYIHTWLGWILAYHGSPLVTPWSSIVNVWVWFIMFIYITLPICYWKFNTFYARKFPLLFNQLFTSTEQKYDTAKIFLTMEYNLNTDECNKCDKLYLSPLFALSIRSGFTRFMATLYHDSPWTCRKYRVTFDASVICGFIGQRWLFGPNGLYWNLVWLFLVGAVLPVLV
jgi:hypothetical protein